MTETSTYDPSFFEQLREAERNHFWFRIRRRWIFDRLKKLIPPPAEILEIGCGTGNVSSFLAKKGYRVTGCEYYQEAVSMAWPGFQIVQGDAHNLPFENKRFDIVGLFDVIEHFQDDEAVLREAERVLKDRGIMVVTVPAREELWSWVDEVSLHKRRYTKDRINRIFLQFKLEPLLIEYMFMSLYLPMKYLRRNHSSNKDLFKVNNILNSFFTYLFHSERLISRRFSLPIGTSIIGIAQKNRS